MQWYPSRLPSGLHLVTIKNPHSQLVAIKVCARGGSRYDGEIPGLSHVLEHMLLSGSRQHTAPEIHDAIDSLGGEMNAQTGKDHIGIHCVLPRRHWLTGLEVLSEVLLSPSWSEEALAREKKVIIEEIWRARDQRRAVLALFAETLWDQYPLRNSILGLPEYVLLTEMDSLRQMYARHFTAANLSIAVCGDLDHDEVVQQIVERFGSLPAGEELPRFAPFEPAITAPRHAHIQRETGQVMMMLGVPAVGMQHPDRGAIKLLERILGMGLGARLYRRLRIEQQLVYTLSTATANYEEAGYLGVHTVCHPRHSVQVREAILAEFENLAGQGVTEPELKKAQINYEGALLRNFETNLALANMAALESLLSQVESLSQSIERIQAVTLEQINAVARRYLRPEKHVLATVGEQLPQNLPETQETQAGMGL